MNVFWRLSQAIAWIAARNDEAVAEAPDAIVLLLLVDTEDSVPEARTKLWTALQAGRITATGINSVGHRVTIARELWHDLQPFLEHNIETLHRSPLDPGDHFIEVVVSREDVRVLWPPADAAPAEPPSVKRKDLPEEVAELIVRHWPSGKPPGMKVKDFENAIIERVKAETGTTVSPRTVKRARNRAK